MQLTAGFCAQYFAAHGVECAILPLPTNEANKGFELVFEIARHLEEFKLNRYAGQITCHGLQFSLLACTGTLFTRLTVYHITLRGV